MLIVHRCLCLLAIFAAAVIPLQPGGWRCADGRICAYNPQPCAEPDTPESTHSCCQKESGSVAQSKPVQNTHCILIALESTPLSKAGNYSAPLFSVLPIAPPPTIALSSLATNYLIHESHFPESPPARLHPTRGPPASLSFAV